VVEVDFEGEFKKRLKEVMMMVMLEVEIKVMERYCDGGSEDGGDRERS